MNEEKDIKHELAGQLKPEDRELLRSCASSLAQSMLALTNGLSRVEAATERIEELSETVLADGAKDFADVFKSYGTETTARLNSLEASIAKISDGVSDNRVKILDYMGQNLIGVEQRINASTSAAGNNIAQQVSAVTSDVSEMKAEMPRAKWLLSMVIAFLTGIDLLVGFKAMEVLRQGREAVEKFQADANKFATDVLPTFRQAETTFKLANDVGQHIDSTLTSSERNISNAVGQISSLTLDYSTNLTNFSNVVVSVVSRNEKFGKVVADVGSTNQLFGASVAAVARTNDTLAAAVTELNQTNALLGKVVADVGSTNQLFGASVAAVARTNDTLAAAVTELNQTNALLGKVVADVGSTNQLFGASVAAVARTNDSRTGPVTMLSPTNRVIAKVEKDIEQPATIVGQSNTQTPHPAQ
jgi:hypothetical protein